MKNFQFCETFEHNESIFCTSSSALSSPALHSVTTVFRFIFAAAWNSLKKSNEIFNGILGRYCYVKSS